MVEPSVAPGDTDTPKQSPLSNKDDTKSLSTDLNNSTVVDENIQPQ
jgi:hypothetical protein